MNDTTNPEAPCDRMGGLHEVVTNPGRCQAQHHAIEWECSHLLVRFYDHFDRWNYEEMVALFMPDGVWHRAGKVLAGRAAIVEELQKRSTTQKVRHVLTNLLVNVHDAAHADAQCYLTVYRHDSGTKSEMPVTVRSPDLFLVVTASLMATDEGWRISKQVMKREFEFGC